MQSKQVLEMIDAIMESQRLKNSIESHQKLAEELFLSEWKDVHSNWERLNDVSKWLLALQQDINQNKLPEWILDFLALGPDKTRLEHIPAELERLMTNVNHMIRSLEELLVIDTSVIFEEDNNQLIDQDYSFLVHLFSLWIENASELYKMANYNTMVDQIREDQLQPYIKLCESWELADEHLLDTFRWNWYQAIVLKAFSERPALANFDRSRHEYVVTKFRELDRLLAHYNRVQLSEEHWRMLPNYEAGGQLGVLRREFAKKSRHLPIRQLMNKAGKAIQAIKPVFMMGPLSIATYIQAESMEFDLVIFDEASQVKPVDAFGAIIRSKQAIVVGDNQQLPPTNFFDVIAKEDDRDDENFTSDMESILGLFLGQNAPQTMLRWHYRSRHESLINVSNHEFYDNNLVIFPSPDADKKRSGLIYNHLPNTFYDRGRSRTNKEEAQAVAMAVLEHAKKHPDLTLGVAAFSMAQMQAVMDEIELLRRANPSTESFFAAHPHEPFFVKNLENVQGDERDVIFISTGYGKTKEGYLSMDFGALNREGGERRLNVLITRARIRCEVFTNLSSDDIDLTRSQSRGVKALKTFLKYAETGYLDIPSVTGKDFDSPFEEAVHKSLVDLGYDVHKQIGSDGFYIDLAIMDQEGRYLLGIECDGATYHSSRSARDRDRLRQEVLEGLGWVIHRIWSTDWFRHQDRELRRVVQAIEEAKIKKRTEYVGEISERKAQLEIKNEIIRDTDPSIEKDSSGVVKYQMADLRLDLEGKEFHTLPISQVADWVYQVVKIESPVHVQEVMKRICDAAGIGRIGRRIKAVFEELFTVNNHLQIKGDFLWLKDMNESPVRDRSELKVNKKVEFIAKEELEEAIILIVRRSFGVQMDQAAQSVYRSLGFTRITKDMKVYLAKIIVSMIKKNRVQLKDNELTI